MTSLVWFALLLMVGDVLIVGLMSRLCWFCGLVGFLWVCQLDFGCWILVWLASSASWFRCCGCCAALWCGLSLWLFVGFDVLLCVCDCWWLCVKRVLPSWWFAVLGFGFMVLQRFEGTGFMDDCVWVVIWLWFAGAIWFGCAIIFC